MYVALACGALLLVLVFVPDLLKRADKSAGKRESDNIRDNAKRRLHKHPII